MRDMVEIRLKIPNSGAVVTKGVYTGTDYQIDSKAMLADRLA